MFKKLVHKFWSIVYRFRYGRGSKICRIHSLKPLFLSGKIRFTEPITELEKELMEYRKRGPKE